MNQEERLRRQKQFLVKFAFWAVWGTMGVLLVKFVGPILLPFIAAFFVAAVLAYPVDFVSEKSHIKRSLVAILFVFLFYVLVAGLLYLLGHRIIELLRDASGEITTFLSDTVVPMFRQFCVWLDRIMGGAGSSAVSGGSGIYQTADASDMAGATGRMAANGTVGLIETAQAESARVMERAGKLISGMSGAVMDGVSNVATAIPGICMNILLAVIATVFMELEFPAIMGFLKRQVPDAWQKTAFEVRDYALGTLGRCIVSYILIFGMTFAELAIGFLILRIDGAFAIAFIIAALDILPVFGTGTVLLPWMIIAFASGNLKMGIGILALYLLITVVRNIVEPKLVGRQIGLSPVVMLPCMILGLKFFGIIGLFLVPFSVAFLKSLNDRGIIHIFKGH